MRRLQYSDPGTVDELDRSTTQAASKCLARVNKRRAKHQKRIRRTDDSDE